MKTLLFLNGPEGSQAGVEDGFTYLHSEGEISALKWFYFEDFSQKNSSIQCILKIIEIANEFLPELIVFFHISNFPINNELLSKLRKLPSQPLIIYDEGDIYGGFSKPISSSMKTMFKFSDIVSIRGLGKWYKTVKKYNKNVIYTPHCNSLYRLTKNIVPNEVKKEKIVFIGNRVKSVLGRIFRLPGALGREQCVENICKYFPTKFNLYGKDWTGFPGDMGKLEFFKQADICSNTLIQVSYEHYPNVPFYFSDRLPIALASGQIYVCHFHKGYDVIFKNCDFIYTFKTAKESIDLINYILSLNSKELYNKSICAKEFADKFLSPEIIWGNFIRNIKSI